MYFKSVHVGKMILNHMKKHTTLRQKDLCPILKCEEAAVGKKLRKKHFGTIEEIIKVCEFIEHDFFRDISDSLYPDKHPEYELQEKISTLNEDIGVYRSMVKTLKAENKKLKGR